MHAQPPPPTQPVTHSLNDTSSNSFSNKALQLRQPSAHPHLAPVRLCRVEFQNKFYAGDGRKFLPFCYARLFAADED
jgi:hypothetical protein